MQEWQDTWSSCDYAPYFHSPEWAQIWNTASKGQIQPAPQIIRFTDGAKALIPLSFRYQYGKLVKQYVSSPEGTYGGWISQDPLDVAHSALLVDYLLKKCRNLCWLVNPYDKNVFKTGISRGNYQTHALNLSAGFDALVRKFSRGNLRAIDKARDHGIITRTASSLDEWREYFNVYSDALQRWGKKGGYQWALFEELYRRKSRNISLRIAMYKDRVVAGTVCFFSKQHTAGWHMTTLNDYMEYSPANLLNYENIKDSVERGHEWYDFNPSGGHKGVIAWKEKFGPETLDCPLIWSHSSTMQRLCQVFKVMIG
jgi:hypothetical protein